MLKPANNDPNVKDAMERFNKNTADFGPSKLEVIYPNVGAGKDEAAFKVLRDEARESSAKQEQKHVEETAKLKAEIEELKKEKAKETNAGKKTK